MAITIETQPTGINSLYKPMFFVYSTNLTYDLSFRFRYSIYLPNTEYDNTPYTTTNIFKGISVPTDSDLSYNSASEILKNVSKFNFNPDLTGIDRVQDNMIFFTEYIEEVDNTGSLSNATSNVIKAMRHIDSVTMTDYILAGNTSFLSKFTTHSLRITDDCTLRTIQTDDSNFKYAKYNLVVSDSTYEEIEFKIENPYFDKCDLNGSTLQWNGDNNIIEIKAGNFGGITVIPLRYKDGTGWHAATHTSETLIVSGDNISLVMTDSVTASGELTSYTIEAFDDKDASLSVSESFTIVQDCRFDSVNVAWENGIGGVDYFLFDKANEKTISLDKTVYERTPYKLNTEDNTVDNLDYSRNNTIYRNKTVTTLEANTNWLSQTEIDNLEDLFKSTETYIYYGGEWLYVLNTAKEAVIYNKKRKGLKKYKIHFTFSKPTIR